VSERLIAVTGAGGFIGSAVCRRLVASGRVHALIGPPGETGTPVSGVARHAYAEIVDRDALADLFAGADAVIHLAGPPSVRASFDDPMRFARVHVEGTVAALDAARAARVARFVYVSSAEVYGRPQSDPVAETHPLEARSPYAAAKIGAEQMVRAYGHAFGLVSAIVRPFSVYGPEMGPHSLVRAIVRQLGDAGPLRLADLRPVRDYCFIDDVARAIDLATQAELAETVALNIGSGVGTSVAELARTAIQLSGRERELKEETANRRPGNAEILRLVADRTRAHELLGWEPNVTLAGGLLATIAAENARR
jgi:nucleoside-diphosphate-sugar epimerase